MKPVNIREILEKQLQLLSEVSHKTKSKNAFKLVALTFAMVFLVKDIFNFPRNMN